MKCQNRLSYIYANLIQNCVERGLPKCFHGDLFHDARWMLEHSKRNSQGDDALTDSFYWALRETGTSIVDTKFDLSKHSLVFGKSDITYFIKVIDENTVEMERVE